MDSDAGLNNKYDTSSDEDDNEKYEDANTFDDFQCNFNNMDENKGSDCQTINCDKISKKITLENKESNENNTEHHVGGVESNDNEFSNDGCLDEVSQEDYEKGLSEEELLANKLKAVQFKEQGNEKFRIEEYEKSLEIYTDGLNICPLIYKDDRSILYGNRAAAYIKLNDNKNAVNDCTKSLDLNPNYMKSLNRRAKLHEMLEQYDESLVDYKKILELEPGNKEAQQAVARLPQIINERNEKLKDEMIGKLKDLGNMILKPFGLSTNNFQMQQDPNTGSYSINFKQGGSS